MELADVPDSKSGEGDLMWVRFPPSPPKSLVILVSQGFFMCMKLLQTAELVPSISIRGVRST